jgi:hypothetical protein
VPALILWSSQQVWKPGNVDSDPPCLVARQPVHGHTSAGLVLEVDVGERLSLGVAYAERLAAFIKLPKRRKCAAIRHSVLKNETGTKVNE